MQIKIDIPLYFTIGSNLSLLILQSDDYVLTTKVLDILTFSFP